LVASEESESGTQLLKAISRASGNRLLIIDASAELSASDLQKLSDSSSDIAVAGANLEINGDNISNLSSELIVSAIASSTAWPISAIMSSKKNFEPILSTTISSAAAVLVAGITQAIANGLNIQAVSASSSTTLSKQERASVLEYVVNNFNIEDLFPNHAWKEHGEESAAACYHTLAAQFIKLNKIDSALECLSFSDRLEDSPRSLALKALIAAEKGETLGAVANMVSSLQEYEKRKIETTGQYLNFIPTDLNLINENLNAGLEALNKRDNETALEFFSTAVFNFDSFYKDCGFDDKVN
ncbi:MAG: hypothetical protein R3A13_06810, partial [Bdellovibrionota bacterium]